MDDVMLIRQQAPLVGMLAIGLTTTLIGSSVKAACSFLPPVGGDGSNDNWNTDFAVNGVYRSYKLFFTADSTASGTYPVEAYLKFTDGSNLRVVQESMTPPIGTGRMFGPFSAPDGKTVSQINFKIGTGSDPDSTGFSYRISVQGCN
jgi:hypothetical protein